MDPIQIIVGPGHHDKMVIEALQSKGVPVKSFHYWPYFNVKDNGRELIPGVSKAYGVITWLTYAVKSRLQQWMNYEWNLDHLFLLYDQIVSRQVSYNNQPLIGWPQVSKRAFQKWRKNGGVCILEHPMVHVNEWMAIMQQAYQLVPQKGYGHSLFTAQMQKRMLEEYTLADKINVLSTYAYNTFIQHGIPKGKLVITPLGIDTQAYRIINSSYPREKFVFLFVGRLEMLKGVHLLVEAFNRLKLPGAELWLVGDKRKEIVPYLRGANIKWLGTKTKEELVDLYNQANCLVLPSLQESFGLVILEAMACGIPVIASANTGGPDIIVRNEFGKIFKSGDIDELTLQMKSTYENFHFNKLNIRSHIEQHFSLQQYYHRFATNLMYGAGGKNG